MRLVVRGANITANGKRVTVAAGSAYHTSDKGKSGSIGAAPSGGWCSDTSDNGYIWGAMRVDLPGGDGEYHNIQCWPAQAKCAYDK